MSLSFSAGVSGTVVSAVRASTSGIAASASAAGIIVAVSAGIAAASAAVITTGGVSAVIATGISTVITARIRAGRSGIWFAAGAEAIGVGVWLGLDQFFLADAAYHFMRSVAIVHILLTFLTDVTAVSAVRADSAVVEMMLLDDRNVAADGAGPLVSGFACGRRFDFAEAGVAMLEEAVLTAP